MARDREKLEYVLRRLGAAGVIVDIGSNGSMVQLSPNEDTYEAQLHLRSPVGRVTFPGREVRAADDLREMVGKAIAGEAARLRGQMLIQILNSDFFLPTRDEVSLQVVESVSIKLMEVVDRARKEPGR